MSIVLPADRIVDSPLFETDRGALFSPDREYRYLIWHRWDLSKPWLSMCLLNPSRADESRGDPTFDRSSQRAVQLGCGGLRIANAYALRSPHPVKLYNAADPVGPENDHAILVAATDCKYFICGWGEHANKVQPGRVGAILTALLAADVRPYALRVNRSGEPTHPLYLPYNLQPFPL